MKAKKFRISGALAVLLIVAGTEAFLDPSHNFFIENSAGANAAIIVPQAEAMYLSDGSINPDYFSFRASAEDTANSLVGCAEPVALWMFGSVLGLLGWMRRKAA